MATAPATYAPTAQPLTPEEAQTVITGSGVPGATSGLPTNERNGNLSPFRARGLYPNPGVYDAVLRGDPVASTGDMRQRRYVAGLYWEFLDPEDSTPEEQRQTDLVASWFDSIPDGGLSGLIQRVMSREARGFSLHEMVYIDPANSASGYWEIKDAVEIQTHCVQKWLLGPDGLVQGVLVRDEAGDHRLWCNKLLLSIRDGTRRTPEGRAALRPLVGYCEAARDTLASDTASFERAARGTLIGIEGTDASDADRKAFDGMAANWQSGGQAWVRLPNGWDVRWDYGGDIPDPSSRVEIYHQAVARVFDDELQSLGQNKYGARAVGSEMRISTQRQLTGVLEELACDLTAQLVRPLYVLNNWDVRRICTLSSSGFFDPEKIDLLIKLCSGPDPLIKPDDRLKKALRRMVGLR